MKLFAALACGVAFGAGLTLAGMTDPSRVIGFLDMYGQWDPSLAVVMASALAITLPAFRWAGRRARPMLEHRFHHPERTRVDHELIRGAIVFGIGWGLAGLCPGPAIAALASGEPQLVAFVLAMLVGMAARDYTNASSRGAVERTS